MSLLRGLQSQLARENRSLLIVTIGIIVAALIGNILFIRFFIVPQWETRNELAEQLTALEEEVLNRQAQEPPSAVEIQAELEVTQSRLDALIESLLSEGDAADVLNDLYRYAELSGVEIVEFESQTETEPVEEDEDKAILDINRFRLQAVGDVRRLIDFVTRIEQVALNSVDLDNVGIADPNGITQLSMEITLYTSPYAGEDGAGEPTPNPTEVADEIVILEAALADAWEAEDWPEAIDLINQILAIDLTYNEMTQRLYAAHINYGYQLLAEGNYEAAADQFRRALAIDPDGSEAQAGLDQASTAVPTDTPTTDQQFTAQLDEAWADQAWVEVIQLLQEGLERSPGDQELTRKLYAAYVNHGYQLADQAMFTEAKEAFIQALAVNPEGAEALQGLEALSDGVTPVPPTPTPADGYVIHVVRPGENLFRISLRYGVSVEAIQQANGLAGTSIYVGQRLRIPIQ